MIKKLVMVCVLLAVTTLAAGDVLKTKNGKTYEGKLISRTGRTIVFEIHKFGAKITKDFNAADVL
ncbi:MAG TPA: hypothetical protein ENL03_05835, partial [Phycisphaerae bacterium]|nr:hypothetical protein [Phycisphaerae bacterium]